MNDTDRINYTNIGLMALAALAAFLLPFEVFLFSYAVLGPLHYLTEISWLHEKRYFTRYRYDYLLLAFVAVALLVLGFGLDRVVFLQPELKETLGNGLIYCAFASALVMIALKKWLYRFWAFVFILATAQFLKDKESAILLFSVFLPTLIHVFLFTGAFVLFGALKGRSRSGLLSFAAFLLFPALLWLGGALGWGLTGPVRENTQTLYEASTFPALNQATIRLFNLGEATSREQLFFSSYGLLVMRFIAWAYTYHYLNWFSKTKVIRWHEVSRGRIAFIALVYIASVGLYAVNYRWGVIGLYCLSFLHVFLEFPLNHVTFIGIGRELARWVKPAAPAPLPG